MKQDDELWMKKMKEMLQDYDEAPPSGGWEKLSQSLLPPAERSIISRKWWGVAAAVLLLAVSGVSFYFLHTPAAEDIRLTDIPVVDVTSEEIPVAPVISEPETPYIVYATTKKRINATVKDNDSVIVTEPIVSSQGADESVPEKDSKQERDDKNVGKSQSNSDNAVRTVSKSGKRPFTPVAQKRTSRKNLALGLSVNSGPTSFSKEENQPLLRMSNMPQLSPSDLVNVVTNVTGYKDISDKNMVFADGKYQVVEFEKIEHKLPITVGVSLRKEIGNGFSVETGLSYTFLKSDIIQSTQQGEVKGEQKLHYLGIPVKANWDFINNKNFTLYLSAGGTVEKCIYGKILDKKNTVKELQLSLNGGVGAQYNLTKHVGIYIEPGVSYFFDDGSKVETIRKETPFNFNLQGGVRFMY
jgi:Opacity protein and related surface antigens